MGEPPVEAKLLLLDGEITDIALNIQSYISILTENGIFYRSREFLENGEAVETISSWNMSTKRKEIVLKGTSDSFTDFYLSDNHLFVVDDEKECLVIKDLSSGKETTHKFFDDIYPYQILRKSKDSIIILGEDENGEYRVAVYNYKARTGRTVATLEDGKYDTFWDNSLYKDGYVYCKDLSDNIVKIDIETGVTEVLISIEEIGKRTDFYQIDYCTDYIVVQAMYDHIKKMLVFDYSGKKIKTKYLFN